MPIVTIRKHKIAYETHGHGFPLLFVHGLGGDSKNWVYQVKEFSQRYRVVTIDLRGHGSSEAPVTGYSLDAFTEDVAEFIKIMGLGKVYYVGLSMGGMIGQNFAATHPELLQALVLCSTSSKPGRMTENGLSDAGKMMELSAKIAEEKGRAPLADTTIKLMFTENFIAKNPEIIAQVKKNIIEGPTKGYVGAICNIFLTPLDLEPLLPSIKTPTLIIGAGSDQLTPFPESERIHKGIHGSELKKIGDCGHVSIIEKHTEFNAILAEFLRKMDAKRYKPPKVARAFM